MASDEAMSERLKAITRDVGWVIHQMLKERCAEGELAKPGFALVVDAEGGFATFASNLNRSYAAQLFRNAADLVEKSVGEER